MAALYHPTSRTSFLPRSFFLLIGCYVWGVLLFACYRLAFYLSFRDQAGGAPAGEVLYSFLVGWRFDQVVILAALIPLLVILPWVSLRSRGVKIFTVTYTVFAFGVMALALLGDLRYFRTFDTHLNFQVVQYLQGGDTTWHVVRTDPYFWLLIGIWFLVVLGTWAVTQFLIRKSSGLTERPGWFRQILWFLLFAVLFFVGIRGRTSLSPIDWGLAYWSDNAFLNQLGLNSVYTFGRAFTEEGQDPRLVYVQEYERFSFIPTDAALDTVQYMLKLPNDEWLQPEESLRRRTTNQVQFGFEPNIIIVVMETWSGRHTGCLGYHRDLTPHFDSLAAHGLLFTQFYANGARTNYGLGAILCSYPSLPGRSVLQRYNAHHPFVALSEILRERGYFNGFAYGGDIAFDNMEGFFTTKAYDKFYGDTYFGKELEFAKWGIPDHVIFEKVTALSDSLPRPFQLTVLTLSNHEPWDLPDSSVQKFKDNSNKSRILNAQVYADYAVGKFIEQFRQKPSFDSTLFVFVPDHCYHIGYIPSPHPENFHAPLLIYSPALLGTDSQRVTTVGSQVDILPTLMGILGTEYIHESWGRDLRLVPPDDSGFAVINHGNKVAMIMGRHLVVEPLGILPAIYSLDSLDSLETNPLDVRHDQPELFDKMIRQMHAYLQLADQLATPKVK